MVLQLPDERLPGLPAVGLGEHDRRLDDLAADLVGNARNGALHHRRVGHQGALHLERTDAVARTLDHVVGTPHEPVVAVLVAPRHVARIIHPVVPRLAGQLIVQVVTLEQTEGLAPVGADHDLPLLAVLGRTAVGGHQVDPVLGIGHAHAPGFGLHPRERGQRQRRLGLPEALHQTDARQAQEGVVHGSVQRLARRGAVLQRREVVFGEILADQEAVDRRRRAQRRDAVLLDLAQHVRGRELLVVVDEQAGPGQPLPVEFAPRGLGPPRVGDRQVQAAFVEVVPQQPRGDMPQRIGEVVGHHLRLAGRPRGEIHHHHVVVGVHPLRAHERSRLFDAGVEIEKPFGDLGTHADEQFGGGAFGHGRRDVIGDHPLARRDDGLDPGRIAAVDYVLFGQQVGCRDHHRAQLVQRQN